MSNNQIINVPRDEVERLVKLLHYQSHPYPSPHAEFWQGLLNKPAPAISVQRFWSHEAQNIRCIREADYDALELRLINAEAGLQWESERNALLLDELQAAESLPQNEPVSWGAPKTVRQLIRQLETLDQDLRPLSMLRVPASAFEDGKERVRATHLSFSHERVEGEWLAPFKSDGEKVLAFWCRIEQPERAAVEVQERSPKDYAIEHAEYMAASADQVIAEYQAYGLALMAVDEGGDDGESELFDTIDSAREDLQEALVTLRSRVYEFRKRRDRIATPGQVLEE